MKIKLDEEKLGYDNSGTYGDKLCTIMVNMNRIQAIMNNMNNINGILVLGLSGGCLREVLQF